MAEILDGTFHLLAGKACSGRPSMKNRIRQIRSFVAILALRVFFMVRKLGARAPINTLRAWDVMYQKIINAFN